MVFAKGDGGCAFVSMATNQVSGRRRVGFAEGSAVSAHVVCAPHQRAWDPCGRVPARTGAVDPGAQGAVAAARRRLQLWLQLWLRWIRPAQLHPQVSVHGLQRRNQWRSSPHRFSVPGCGCICPHYPVHNHCNHPTRGCCLQRLLPVNYHFLAVVLKLAQYLV